MDEYLIKRLGHLGDGITEEGYFAPLTLPDERVSAEREGKDLKSIKILNPSDDRVKPPCPHFKSCGGCVLQHASDAFVAEWKVSVVRETLATHNLETDLRPCLTSPTYSRRRATFTARRTKKGALVGFHAKASDTVIDIQNCTLARPELLEAKAAIHALTLLGASRKSVLKVQVTCSRAGLDLAVSGGKALDRALETALAEQVQMFSLARLTWEDDVIAVRSSPVQSFGRAKVLPPPYAFLQATKEGEQDLLKTVISIIGGAGSVLDLFSGCGTFALPLSETAEVHAVEGDRDMMRALDKAWRETSGLKKLTHETRDLYRRPLLPDELARFEATVIDPPRAGAKAQVSELAKGDLKTIAYVSCNPISFAADAAILCAAGYHLQFVQTVDQFRWSNHIELVGAFELM